MIRLLPLTVIACALAATAARAEVIVLTTGETIKAPIASQNDEQVIVQHPILGQLTVPRAGIASIAPDPAPAEVGEPAQAAVVVPPTPPAEPAEPEAAPPPAGFFDGWSSKLEIGFTFNDGNTENADLLVSFVSVKETETDRWKADTSYFLAFDSGDRTDNKFTAGLLKDWLIPDSKWFYWAKARYDYDEFKSWNQRVAASAGLGYHLIQEDDMTLDLRAGLGAAREFGSNDKNVKLEAPLGFDWDWKLTEQQSVGVEGWAYPDLTDLPEARYTLDVFWQVKLDFQKGLAFKLGLFDEYETQVDPGDEHNDIRIYGSLVYEF